MTVCEMCGNETQLFKAVIEGTELQVCRKCAKFGKILRKVRIVQKQKPATLKEPKKELIEVVVNDFAKRVRESREKTGMTQEEFAKAINERESIVKKLETGAFVPPISMARKLEKLLKIKLVEEVEEEQFASKQKKRAEGLTIGDILQLKP